MKRILLPFILILVPAMLCASDGPDFMTNVYGRDFKSLGGRWDAIVDVFGRGERGKFYLDAKPKDKTEFYEYSFEGGLQLDVPGDWNHQEPELKYYEGTVWYARHIDVKPEELAGRKFLYFAGVSYRCKVYLNGQFLCSHEGSFTPFQVEVTDVLKEGDNFLCVAVSNVRTADAIPAMDFDWWNYGGITRDVLLVSVPDVFVDDYGFSLRDGLIDFSASLSAPVSRKVKVEIPELRISRTFLTDTCGKVRAVLKPKGLQVWSPANPRLYDVRVSSGEDSVGERIGFRTVAVDGTRILINGKPTFLKSVSFHEEIPQQMRRATSPEDARQLVDAARDLGCNMVRLAHYPQNEYIVRYAEQVGIVLWEEIPLWQGIDFKNLDTKAKAVNMYREMLRRDRNRCAVCIWGVANETRPSEARNAFLTDLITAARSIDGTRLYAIADDIANYDPEQDLILMNDPFISQLDVVAVNKYLGWYAKWPKAPGDLKWKVAEGKPLVISEFGCEAMYGRTGDADIASSWSEDYQAALYRDNLQMFEGIENLAGISPWVLYDFRSPRRFHPVLQDGWNRKGLLSDKGEKKKAWYVINDWYQGKE